MWALVATTISIAVIVPIAVFLGRNGRVSSREPLWSLPETAARQVIISGGLAGFAITGIVLLVTLARDRTEIQTDSFNAVVFMFLTAYLFLVATAFLFAFLPREDPDGGQPARIQFVLAGNLEYRSLLLAWFAMRPLMQTFGLNDLADLTAGAITCSICVGSLLGLAIFHGIGAITFREVVMLPVLSVIPTAIVGTLSVTAVPELESPTSALYLTAALYGLNVLTFAHYAVGLLYSVEAIRRLASRYSRLICLADLQATMLLMSFIWLAVMGIV